MNDRDPAPKVDASTEESERLHDEHLRGLGSMLVGIAHELNTPLGVVMSTCDGLQRCRQKLRDLADKPALDAEDHERLRGILEHMESGGPVLAAGLQRMEALIRELRLQARAGDGIALEPASLLEILEGDLLLLHHQLKQGVTVERRFAAQPTVMAHPVFLGQVFLNLLRNAIQAMEGAGTLTISVDADESRAEVRIADSGPGIPAAVLARLFQGDVTTKSRGEGTGIGLMNSRRIVAKHGGTIAAANGPHGGAVFTVTLPLA
jgi:signal transduction histidine kinase